MNRFDRLRSEISALPQEMKKKLLVWLQTQVSQPSALTTTSSHQYQPEQLLYSEVRRSLQHLDTDLPTFHEMCKINPSLKDKLRVVAAHIDSSLIKHFPSATHVDRLSLLAFFVDCARSRLLDLHSTPTLYRMLEVLMPVLELLDDRFPGYRECGVLESTLLSYLHRKE